MWTLRSVLAATALGALSLTAAAPAAAQSATSSVTVDMSVLDDGGYGSTLGTPGMVGGLKIPGRKVPRSTFHAPPGYTPSTRTAAPAVAPRGKITLKKPGTMRTRAAAPKPAPRKAVAAAKPAAPKPMVKAAPKAQPKPKPMVAKPAAPKAVAAKPAAAKPAPAKPAKVMAKKPAPAPKPAPKAAAVAKAPPKAPVKAAEEKMAKTSAKKSPPPAPAAPQAPKAPKPMAKKEVVKQAPAPAPAATVAKAVDPGALKPGRVYQVMFSDAATKLPSDAAPQLETIVKGLKNSSSLRLQLMAYAGSDTMTPNNARRMSLRRALFVRSFLIDQGMRSTRIDVRALGNKTSEKPLNRVDVMVVER